jgi:hypothetical protein
MFNSTQNDANETVDDSLLVSLYGEDIDQIFGKSQKEIKYKKKPRFLKKNTFKKELEQIHLNSVQTFETIDRLIGNNSCVSMMSMKSFDGLNSQIDYQFMNSIIYK